VKGVQAINQVIAASSMKL